MMEVSGVKRAHRANLRKEWLIFHPRRHTLIRRRRSLMDCQVMDQNYPTKAQRLREMMLSSQPAMLLHQQEKVRA
ncbi:hypothetical protein CLOM_g19631 [Closterium sp. NIES-68]|nr:hypothetical protein CLOM_g19631 [Closterium sp. NIES-68]